MLANDKLGKIRPSSGLMGLGIGGWQPSKLWECLKIPHWGIQCTSHTQFHPVQSQTSATDEEDTSSMRELIWAIDDDADNVDLEVTSNLNAADDTQSQLRLTGNALGQ